MMSFVEIKDSDHIVIHRNGVDYQTPFSNVVASLPDGGDVDLDSLNQRYVMQEGITDLPADTDWKIRQQSPGGSNKTLIHSKSGELGLYNLKTPTESHHAVNKEYCDAAAGVPVGSIMMWINSAAPTGWLKLKGGSFSTSTYPLLHAYLQNTAGYVAGTLPDWRGHYPGQLGDHLNGDVGILLPQQTAKPSGGSPYEDSYRANSTNTKVDRGYNGEDCLINKDKTKVTIGSGWDSVTRPKTVAVHFIIKHD